MNANWDSAQINRWFKHRAEAARLYVGSHQRHAADNMNYQALIDEHSAIWAVNDHFIDRDFLESRVALLNELHRIETRPPASWPGIFDKACFTRHWVATARQLRDQYTPPSRYGVATIT